MESEESNASTPVESQAYQHGQAVLSAAYSALEESMLPIVELDLTADTLTIEFGDGSTRELSLSEPIVPDGGLNPAVPATPGDPAHRGEPAT